MSTEPLNNRALLVFFIAFAFAFFISSSLAILGPHYKELLKEKAQKIVSVL